VRDNVIKSLWIGGSLSPMEQVSIRSFLRRGHEFHLYTYGIVYDVPEGVVVKSAEEVLPLSLRHYKDFPQLALFADFFRYKLLLEKGGWWSDTDAVCVKPFDFEEDYVFSSEVLQKGGTHINNGTIKAPAGCPILQRCWDSCLAMNPRSIPWGASGPALVRAAVGNFKLERFVQSPNVFCPVPWWEVRKFVTPGVLEIPEEARTVHLWNSSWGWEQLNKNTFVPGSPYERFRDA